MTVKIQLRKDTKDRWLKNDPILYSGELGIELDTNNIKIGNGVSKYSELKYINSNEELEKELKLISSQLLSKANTTYVDNELSKKADISSTYTKTEIDEKINNINVDVDLSPYYTKTEIDEMFGDVETAIEEL